VWYQGAFVHVPSYKWPSCATPPLCVLSYGCQGRTLPSTIGSRLQVLSAPFVAVFESTRTLRLPATTKPANRHNSPDAEHQPERCLSDPAAANAQRAFFPFEHWNQPRGWRGKRRAPRMARMRRQALGWGRTLERVRYVRLLLPSP